MTEKLETFEQAQNEGETASAQHMSPSDSTDTVVIRRARTNRFLASPPPAPESGVVVGRGFLNSKAGTQKPQISRERKIAGDLPSWDPVPPGEVSVRRRNRE
jgi:hypothetical protein